MNAPADIISVNPSRKTLGSLHPERATRFIREKVIVPTAQLPHRKMWLNLTFASTTPGPRRYAAAMLLLRMCFAALLIVSGSFILSGEIECPYKGLDGHWVGLAEVIAGGLLAAGFLERYVMLGMVVMFGIVAGQAVVGGRFDMESLLACAGSLTFMVLGSGRWSVDYLIRRAVIRGAIRRRRRLYAARLSYKAFRVM